MARTVAGGFRRAVRFGRGALGASVFSVLAGWIARAIGVVTVLALTVESVVAGLVGLAAFGLYVGVGFDRAYDALVGRVRPGRGADFVVRVVGYPLGALGIAGGFAAVGAVDPTGTVPGLLPGENPATALLFDGLATLPVGLALAVAGGLLLVEAGRSLFRRVAVSRAGSYVGVSKPSGTVALTGTVAERGADGREDDGADDGEIRLDVSFDEYDRGSDDGATPTGNGERPGPSESGLERRDDDRFATDGGRAVAATDGAGEGDDRELLALAAYGEDDPVVVDRDAERVVATRTDCHPEEWIVTVVTYLVREFHAEHGVDLRDDRETLHRLRIVAKRIREDFEERTETEVLVPFVAEVPGEGAVHLRKTLSVVPPPGDRELRPPFSTVGPLPPEATGDDDVEDDDGGPATFEPIDGAGRPIEEPADESIVEASAPPRRVTTPRTGTECAAYLEVVRENRTRTVEVAGHEVAIPGRRLDSFETAVAPFDVRTFGTRVRVDPDAVELVVLPERVGTDGADAVYEATVGPGDTVTVVGRMEDCEGPACDYRLREGPVGGVVLSDRSPDELSSVLTRGAIARVAVGAPLLVAGLSLSPVVGVGPAVASAATFGVVALGTLLAVGVALSRFLPGYVREPFAALAGLVR